MLELATELVMNVELVVVKTEEPNAGGGDVTAEEIAEPNVATFPVDDPKGVAAVEPEIF